MSSDSTLKLSGSSSLGNLQSSPLRPIKKVTSGNTPISSKGGGGGGGGGCGGGGGGGGGGSGR